jgi:hypothetical protein
MPGNLVTRAWVAERRRSAVRTLALLALFAPAGGYAQQSALVEQTPQLDEAWLAIDGSAPALAFGRYLAHLQERDPFTESGPVNVQIEASLPSLAKTGGMLAVRQMGASERSEYCVIRLDGDSTVKHQVIARYLTAEEQAEALPYSSTAVTPVNYKFRYLGSVETGGAAVYMFQIAPKKKRDGLIRGQIWIDLRTGVAVHQVGRLVKRPSVFIRKIDVTRDTNLQDGPPYTRVTHVFVETRLVGRAELTIIEVPLGLADPNATAATICGGSRP